MADVILKDIVKIYPYVEKKQKRTLLQKILKKKVEEPVKKKTNLQITDKGVVAVQQFNLHIADGEFIVLVGPSGCGKSTTLRMIAGLEEISEGELFIDGNLVNAVEPKDRDIAMVFQSYALYPHMTVYDNMAYPLRLNRDERISFLCGRGLEKANADIKQLEEKLADSSVAEEQKAKIQDNIDAIKYLIENGRKIHGFTRDEIDAKVREAAEILDITEYLDRKPKNLSGGQRQRVAIGRAIVRNPKVLLMDEPLSNLDAKLRNQMRAEIIKLRKRVNTTFVYVTHDQTEAMTLGDRIVVMRDGFIQQVGTPQEVFDHPRNLFVAGFIGTPQMNFFDAKLIKKDGKYSVQMEDLVVELSDEKQERLAANNVAEQDITLGVRPDHMNITKAGITAHVDVAELMGTSYHLHLNYNGKDVILIIPNDGAFTSYFDSDVVLSFDGVHAHVFSKENDRNLEFINEEVAEAYVVKAEEPVEEEKAE